MVRVTDSLESIAKEDVAMGVGSRRLRSEEAETKWKIVRARWHRLSHFTIMSYETEVAII